MSFDFCDKYHNQNHLVEKKNGLSHLIVHHKGKTG